MSLKTIFRKINENNLTIFHLGIAVLFLGVLCQIATRVAFLFKIEMPVIFIVSIGLLTISFFMLTISMSLFVIKLYKNKKNGELKNWLKDIWLDFNKVQIRNKTKKEIEWEEEKRLNQRYNSFVNNMERKRI